MPDFAVILPAAGKAVRFGGEKNKLLCELGGATILGRSVGAFLIRPDVRRIMIATADPVMVEEMSKRSKDSRVQTCRGGHCRAASVKNALLEMMKDADAPEWVAIHDAARPLVSQALIDATLAAAATYGAAAPALAVTLTVKEAGGPLPAKVSRTVPRHGLWAMQTPQIMRCDDLKDAFDRCPIPLEQVTDDLQLLELAGKQAWLVPGDERNIKITTQMDLRLAELIAPT